MAIVEKEPVLARLLKLADDSVKVALLMKAAENGDDEVLQTILSASDPSIVLRTDARWNACMVAAKHGHAKCLRVLLAVHGADQQVLHCDSGSSIAAVEAAKGGHMEALRVLLAHVPQRQLSWCDTSVPVPQFGYNSITRTATKGWTVLQYAASNGRTAVVAEVLAVAASASPLILHRNADGNTALSLAAANGHGDALQLLMTHVIDAAQLSHALAAIQASPLSGGHKRCCQLLLARGASMADIKGEQRKRIELVVQEVMAAYLVPGTVTQAVNDAVVQLASAVRPAKRAKCSDGKDAECIVVDP